MSIKKKRSNPLPIVLIFILLPGIFAASILLALNSDFLADKTVSNNNKPSASLRPTNTSKPTSTPSPVVLNGAVLCGLDTASSELSFYVPEGDSTLSLKYNKATFFYDKFGSSHTLSYFTLGAIVKLCYYPDALIIESISPCTDAWSFSSIPFSSLNSSKQLIEIKNRNYRLGTSVPAFKNEEPIDFSSLHPLDLLTVSGVGDTVYSITVTKGHGHLILENSGAFIGGFLFVDNNTYSEITSAGSIFTFSEGTYCFSVKKGDYFGEKSFTIEDGKTSIFDLSEFSSTSTLRGSLIFIIEPQEAQLFIDKKLYPHTEPVCLNYGEHTVEVILNGYLPYYGTLTVDKVTQTLQIFLPQENLISEHFTPKYTESEP